jgi:hypothetical protein
MLPSSCAALGASGLDGSERDAEANGLVSNDGIEKNGWRQSKLESG